MKTLKSRLFRTCPKSGKIVGVRQPQGWMRLWFPLTGLMALAWFLLRVAPKPSRAAYPCQRVAAPLAGSFLVWLAGLAGASIAFRQARTRMRQARYVAAGLALVVAVAGIAWAVLSLRQPAQAVSIAYTPHTANSPIGVAKGLAPGRVAWAHEPLVTVWNGTSTDTGQRWYDLVSQPKATDLMAWALTGYADTPTPAAAWDAIFRNFNGGAGYQAGEKVFIKINLTTSNSGGSCDNGNYVWNVSCLGSNGWTKIGNSPQLMVALLDQLVKVVGVAQTDITIGDSTGLWVNELYNPLHNTFPNVVYMDARGTLGRTHAARSTVPLYWSTSEAAGKNQDYLLQQVVDAKYVINLAILKSHERNGITVTAKNHFGSLSGGNGDERKPPTTGYYNIHLRLPLDTSQGVWQDRALMEQYRPLVDLNGHAGMGGKTLLHLIDGIYGGRGWNGTPSKWAMAPFYNNWPASLFLSMDQVAIDSVAFDFLSQQWPDQALGNEGVQDYLHEMALADNPPSGAFYDPEHDSTRMASQGVHEHWNNPVDKQYTRNLATGNGIELLKVQKSKACGQQAVLFVGSTNPLPARDQALANHLAAAGYTVTARSQSQAATADALGKDLVIISDSVTSGDVNTKFRDVMAPVITWEPSLYDDMKMVGTTSGTDFGDLTGQTQIAITGSSHPLAAGFSGTVQTTASSQLYFWAVPSANATVVATLVGYPGRAAIFGYEAGAAMVGMAAPARRVGFFNGYGADFTSEGWSLFDAAVKWGVGCSSATGFVLVNGDTGDDIGLLANGGTINMAQMPTQNLNIRVVVDPETVGSMAFAYDEDALYRTDNTVPYTLEGAGGAAATSALLQPAWTPGPGSHTLTAVPFASADRDGRAGAGLTISFNVDYQPTAVVLTDFYAEAQADAVLVAWETASELDHLGFNLYRSSSPERPGHRLAFVPARSSDGLLGARYEVRDAPGIAVQTLWYWLEAVNRNNSTMLYGPVNVTIQGPMQ